MQKQHALRVVFVGVMLGLAGCGGLAGIGGPSVSNTEATVIDNQPALQFEYDIDDYATAIFESPDGEIVSETRLEPEQNSTALYFSDPQAGEYELLIRRGGETITTRTLNFDGPEAQIEQTDPAWSGHVVGAVNVSVRNDGDVPLYVGNSSYTLNGTEVSNRQATFIAPNRTAIVEIGSGFGTGPSITEPGAVEGSVALVTSNGTISSTFSRTLEPASLEIAETDPIWEGSDLEQVDVSVQNVGDVPTEGNVSIRRNGETLDTTRPQEINPNQTVLFEARSFPSIYTVESGGTSEFDVVASSPSGSASDTFRRNLTAASIDVESVTPTWEQGRLTAVQYSATNSGDIEADVSVRVEVNGESVQEYDASIPSGSDEYDAVQSGPLIDPAFVADSGGEYEVTVIVETEDTTTSASDSTRFDGPDASITEIDPTFISSFDGEGSELTAVSFSVLSEGDIVLNYDTIRVSIDGNSRTDSSSFDSELLPGESSNEYVSLLDNLAVDSGSHDLTIELQNDGETVASETTSVSR